MEMKEIKGLAEELMDAAAARKVAQFQLETDEVSISFAFEQSAPAQIIAAAPQAAAATVFPEAQEPPQITGTRVESPLVGTFYSAPSPEEPPFIEVGQSVKKGDTLFIIEAMKTMNEISAPCDGTVSRIFAQNGEMVEYNQLLVVIE